jgi:hypothetical protein
LERGRTEPPVRINPSAGRLSTISATAGVAQVRRSVRRLSPTVISRHERHKHSRLDFIGRGRPVPPSWVCRMCSTRRSGSSQQAALVTSSVGLDMPGSRQQHFCLELHCKRRRPLSGMDCSCEDKLKSARMECGKLGRDSLRMSSNTGSAVESRPAVRCT